MNAMFQPKQPNPNAPANNTAAQKEKWMKDGFLNFSLPDGQGGLAKLGSIGVEFKNPRHRKLIEWLTADNNAHFDERSKLMLAQIVCEFRSAEKDENASYGLPGMS